MWCEIEPDGAMIMAKSILANVTDKQDVPCPKNWNKIKVSNT